ncbi:hypothetical protein EDD21DRAFT_153471 [Dissophora ornata]|nr:hypothetical protein EDD21DRAFT_153471 [Dissophora ornata]
MLLLLFVIVVIVIWAGYSSKEQHTSGNNKGSVAEESSVLQLGAVFDYGDTMLDESADKAGGGQGGQGAARCKLRVVDSKEVGGKGVEDGARARKAKVSLA